MEKEVEIKDSVQSKQQEAIQLEESWKSFLLPEFGKDYMKNLKRFLIQETRLDKTIYPKFSELFQAFKLTPFYKVKAVILGQDPYPSPGQAHGLCFSVKPGVIPPPSLQNIFQEIRNDLKIHEPGHGYLGSWAKQGVLLLNATLSVERGKPGSHQKKGWEELTDQAIKLLSEHREGLVFLLWGRYAQSKEDSIDGLNHLILKAPHPSPLSAHKGFFHCKHFSKTNEYLEKNGQKPIDWSLPAL